VPVEQEQLTVVGTAAAGSAPIDNPVQIGGSDGANMRTLLTDASGRQVMVGAAASGSAVAGNPVLFAGSDGANVRTLLTDASGRLTIIGEGAAGAPAGGVISVQVPDTTASGALAALNNAVSVSLAGSQSVGLFLAAGTLIGTIVAEVSFDGGTTWVATFFDDPVTDNKVASIVFGANNTATTRTIVGAGGASNARVRVSAFTSGTATANLRATQVEDLSQLYAGAAAAAVPPSIAQVGGSDGANLRALLTDTSGRPNVVGAAAAGSAVAGNPVRIGASDGATTRDVVALNSHPTGSEYGVVVRAIERTNATFWSRYDQIAPANNKYMATLFNTSSTRKVVIQNVWIVDENFTSGANSALEVDLLRITARTAGTTVTPTAEDSNDSLSAGITADTASTAVTDSSILRRFQATNGVLSTNTGSTAGTGNYDPQGHVYTRLLGTRGHTLRQDQGISVKCVQSVTVGNVTIIIEFTDEAA
jgi:hypothetical protein